ETRLEERPRRGIQRPAGRVEDVTENSGRPLRGPVSRSLAIDLGLFLFALLTKFAARKLAWAAWAERIVLVFHPHDALGHLISFPLFRIIWIADGQFGFDATRT